MSTTSNKRQVKPEVLAALANMDADYKPIVVNYDANQMRAPPEPPRQQPVQKKPPVPRVDPN